MTSHSSWHVPMTKTKARGLSRYLESLGSRVYHYGNASHGFKDVLLYLKKKSGSRVPNVIMPSFIPAKLYRTVIAAGYEPKFYDITSGCTFDPQQVEDSIDDRTTSIFAIHYFGHPTDIITLADIASRNSVSLIEDCAHVLIGSSKGRVLGTFGDFAIFSARKMLQLSDGGFLLMNKELDGFEPTYDTRVRTLHTSSMFFFSRAKHFYLKSTGGRDFLRITRPSQVGAIHPGRKIEITVKKMSYASTMYERLADIRRNSLIRRENYIELLNRLKDFAFLRPIYEDLPDTWTPYSLPMIMEQSMRTILQTELLKHGVSCGLGWPESPFDNRSVGCRNLSKSLIEFPIHPLMVKRQFDKITDACAEFGKKYIFD